MRPFRIARTLQRAVPRIRVAQASPPVTRPGAAPGAVVGASPATLPRTVPRMPSTLPAPHMGRCRGWRSASHAHTQIGAAHQRPRRSTSQTTPMPIRRRLPLRQPVDARPHALHQPRRRQVVPRSLLPAPVHTHQQPVRGHPRRPLAAKLIPRDLPRLKSRISRHRPDDPFDPRTRRPERLRPVTAGGHRNRIAARVANRPHDALGRDLAVKGPGL